MRIRRRRYNEAISNHSEYNKVINRIRLSLDDLVDMIHPASPSIEDGLDQIKEILYYISAEVKYDFVPK